MQRKNHTPNDTFLSLLPKAELHLHLEGAIQPQTWRRILLRHEPQNNVTEDELRNRMRFTGMTGFFDAWMSLLLSLREPEDYRLAALECGLELGRQNVRYAELHTSIAGAHAAGRLNADEVLSAVSEGLEEARSNGGPEWRLIVDIIRDLAAAGLADTGLGIALRNVRNGVVGIGLGGSEHLYPAESSRSVFAAAMAEGLHTTAHAGECAGADSIREALDIGAERIGHAVSAGTDENLLALLRARGIPLEMCPTSNVCTGAVSAYSEHPAARFLRQGQKVTLNTDDPAFFGVNLNQEFAKAVREFRLTQDEVIRLARNAFECAFLKDTDKHRLLDRFDAEVSVIC